jgi:hypothetical protein
MNLCLLHIPHANIHVAELSTPTFASSDDTLHTRNALSSAFAPWTVCSIPTDYHHPYNPLPRLYSACVLSGLQGSAWAKLYASCSLPLALRLLRTLQVSTRWQMTCQSHLTQPGQRRIRRQQEQARLEWSR